MTLDQLAALLDSLKRPIEEAPKGPNKPAIWACRENDQWMVVFEVEHSEVYGWCGYNNTNYFVTGLTHFLPLPKPGPVEFEVVPVGTVENAFREGMEADDHHPWIGSDFDDAWQGSDAREAVERSYLRGLETGAEVQRLEDEAE